jgi:hypothetical protein
MIGFLQALGRQNLLAAGSRRTSPACPVQDMSALSCLSVESTAFSETARSIFLETDNFFLVKNP